MVNNKILTFSAIDNNHITTHYLRMSSRVDLFTTTNVQKIQQHLDNNPDLDITKMLDIKGNSLLHVSTLQGKIPIIIIYVERIKQIFEKRFWQDHSVYKKTVKQEIEAFINLRNHEGFTCLHFASYQGNIEILEFLESMGGNINVTSREGVNLLHSAAEKDSLNSYLYLYTKLDLNAVDLKQNTPLHRACHFGSQNVLEFLLAQQNVLINPLDKDGQTPLHIAVSNGKTKLVRRLLIRGAERNIRDKTDQLPIDIANISQFARIENMLNNVYTFKDHFSFYFNMKTRYEQESKSFVKPFIFIFLYLLVAVPCHLLIISKFSEIILYAAGGVNLILTILFFSLLKSPPIHKRIDFKYLINQEKICSKCQIIKKDRSEHCDICNICISQFDHHCPWINGCVGKHNIKIFPTFLLLLVILMVENMFLAVVGIGELNFFFDSFRYFGAPEDKHNLLSIIYKVVFGLDLALLISFIGPLSYLMYVQVTNIFLNLTTYERFSSEKKRKQTESSDGSFIQTDKPSQIGSVSGFGEKEYLLEYSNPNHCSFRNCMIMCSKQEEVDDYNAEKREEESTQV